MLNGATKSALNRLEYHISSIKSLMVSDLVKKARRLLASLHVIGEECLIGSESYRPLVYAMTTYDNCIYQEY